MGQTHGSGGWSGRFSEPMTERLKHYNNSIPFDYRLARFDIRGSMAHAAMLARQGILSTADADAIRHGLQQILAEIDAGSFEWSLDLEDVHFNIERRLTERIGEAGKRLHTARSRNDQVATDMRLYVRDALDAIIGKIVELQRVFLNQAERYADVIMPGFTHLQVAQPVTFGHHLMAYYEMLRRDRGRFEDCRRRMNQLPLGAAALAGTSFPIDRESVARDLDFDDVCHNSLDAVSDRDFVIEFAAACSLLMAHFSRLSEELVLWTTAAVKLVEIPDRFCTGSSIMPQKKNPDVPELARGKTGRVYGHLMALLTLVKSQPLAYNKDNQESQEATFDTAETVLKTLDIFVDMVAGLTPNIERMRAAAEAGYATATDLADYLVKRGLAFRDAHEVVSCVVRAAEQTQRELGAFSVQELRDITQQALACDSAMAQQLVADDVQAALSVEGSVAARSHTGGTAPASVRREVQLARQSLKESSS